jgi:AAA+ superfamily predicted ATPase
MHWFREFQESYTLEHAQQFLFYGNTRDLFPSSVDQNALVDLDVFLLERLSAFQTVLTLDIGQGIEVLRGAEHLRGWSELPLLRERGASARDYVERLHHLFVFLHHLERSSGVEAPSVALIIRDAHLLFPADPGASNFHQGAAASLVKDWARPRFAFTLLTCLFSDSLAQLHEVIRQNPFARAVKVGLPSREELRQWLEHRASAFPLALAGTSPESLSAELSGLTFQAMNRLLSRHEGKSLALDAEAVFSWRRQSVEQASNGLISFLGRTKTLADYHSSNTALLDMLVQDMRLFREGRSQAVPMGYLFCGPVGTGKTYLAECLAGSAGVPAITLRNFRDRWVGSSETNLETIFRLIEGLGRCIVFIDEADQALGKRQSDAGSGSEVSGRLYGMFAQFMANPDNRGRVLWVLATSRPDQLEVDLKRPGRIDVKVPILPTLSEAEGYALIRALFLRQGLELPVVRPEGLPIPELLTPGAVATLSSAAFRRKQLFPESAPLAILEHLLSGYLPPVDPEILTFQMKLALQEVTDRALIPESLRN